MEEEEKVFNLEFKQKKNWKNVKYYMPLSM